MSVGEGRENPHTAITLYFTTCRQYSAQ